VEEEVNIRSPDDALMYLTECTLATVCGLAMRKKPPPGEFRRQINIAQKGVEWVQAFQIEPQLRVKDVITDYGGSVNEWAMARRSKS
jgi:hypothetical protein